MEEQKDKDTQIRVKFSTAKKLAIIKAHTNYKNYDAFISAKADEELKRLNLAKQ